MSPNDSFADKVRARVRAAPPKPEPDAPAPPLPKAANDLAATMNLSENIQYSNVLSKTIDVQPDFRFPLITIIWHLTHMYAGTTFKDHAFASPMSVLGYCLALVYGQLLFCDLVERHSASPAAEDFISKTNMQTFLDVLANAYVPPFLIPIIQALMPFRSALRPGLQFVPSLATCYLNHDFGRIFPLSIFIQAHNTLSEYPLNSHPSTILAHWLSQPIATLPAPFNEIDSNAFFALLRKDTTDNNNETYFMYQSWLNSRLGQLMNPVTSRTNAARPIFAEIPFVPPNLRVSTSLASWSKFNQYEFVFGFNSQNFTHITSYLQNISEYVKTEMSASHTLVQIFDSVSSSSIVSHMISGPALPTWYITNTDKTKDTSNVLDVDTTKSKYKFTKQAHSELATLLNFLTPDTLTLTTPVPFPAPNADPKINDNLYLARNQDPTDPREFVLFDADKHVTPDLLTWNPTSSVPSAMFGPICAGLLIQNADVDGITLPLPNIEAPLATTNGSYLSSLVNFADVSSCYVHTTHIEKRVIPKRTVESVALAIWNYAVLRLGRLGNKSTSTGQDLNHSGYTIADGSPSLALTNNWFTFPSTKSTEFSDCRLHVWSSYRVFLKETHDSYDKSPPPSVFDLGFLVSLRHLFGVEIQTGRTPHPSVLIP